jgi:hypothetical protein
VLRLIPPSSSHVRLPDASRASGVAVVLISHRWYRGTAANAVEAGRVGVRLAA